MRVGISPSCREFGFLGNVLKFLMKMAQSEAFSGICAFRFRTLVAKYRATWRFREVFWLPLTVPAKNKLPKRYPSTRCVGLITTRSAQIGKLRIISDALNSLAVSSTFRATTWYCLDAALTNVMLPRRPKGWIKRRRMSVRRPGIDACWDRTFSSLAIPVY